MSLPYWSSTSWLLFSLVVITHKYVFMYAYTFLNIDYLVHMTLLACLFSGLVVWHWETNWCVMIWRKPLLLLPVLLSLLEFFLLFYICVCRVMPSLTFLEWVWHVLWCFPFPAQAWAVVFVKFYGCSFWCQYQAQYHSKIIVSLALKVFPSPFFYNCPRACGILVLCRWIHWHWDP